MSLGTEAVVTARLTTWPGKASCVACPQRPFQMRTVRCRVPEYECKDCPRSEAPYPEVIERGENHFVSGDLPLMAS
ncbi:hypothetical protein ACFX13_034352 [Malus domestica]